MHHETSLITTIAVGLAPACLPSIVPTEARDLVVAGALVSILVNPVLFRALDRLSGAKPAAVPPGDLTPRKEAA